MSYDAWKCTEPYYGEVSSRVIEEAYESMMMSISDEEAQQWAQDCEYDDIEQARHGLALYRLGWDEYEYPNK